MDVGLALNEHEERILVLPFDDAIGKKCQASIERDVKEVVTGPSYAKTSVVGARHDGIVSGVD